MIFHSASALSDVKDVVSVLGTSVTALAVVIGGLWAYFKVFRLRSYHPRVAVQILAQWRLVNGHHLLHVRIIAQNIGASVVTLRQRGTGLRISFPSPQQPEPPSVISWEVVRVFEILGEHAWIAAGDTISDDQLLDIDVAEPVISLLEVRLVWSWHKNENVVLAKQVLAPDSTTDGQSTSI